MDQKRDETSPTPEDKHKSESKGNANVFEYNALQNDIDVSYATFHGKETPKPDKASYKGQPLDTKASIKQENEPRTSAVVRISQNDKGAGGGG